MYTKEVKNNLERGSDPSTGWQLAIAYILGFVAGLWRAALLAPLWTWFITPTTGIAVPSFWILIGLLMTIDTTFMRYTASPEPGAYWDRTIKLTVFSLISWASAFVFGFLYFKLAGG